MDLAVWLPFFAAAWAISLSPGPGALAAMSAGLHHGFRRGYCLTFGLVAGIMTQVALVSAGLGALFAASGAAFALLKWVGAGYLVWLGVKQWRAPAEPMVAEGAAGDGDGVGVGIGDGDGGGGVVSRRSLVLRGWMINAVNPKGTVFMLAVVPQFIDTARPLAGQYLSIAATLVFTDLVVMAGYTLLASRLLKYLKSPAHMRWLNRVFGSLFVLAGVLLASFKRA